MDKGKFLITYRFVKKKKEKVRDIDKKEERKRMEARTNNPSILTKNKKKKICEKGISPDPSAQTRQERQTPKIPDTKTKTETFSAAKKVQRMIPTQDSRLDLISKQAKYSIKSQDCDCLSRSPNSVVISHPWAKKILAGWVELSFIMA